MTMQAVPFTQVTLEDAFWAPRQQTNRTVSIPHSLDMLEQAGNVRNFELAAAGARSGYSGPVFMDSDLYKAVEAASYALAAAPDPELEARIDGIVARIAAAQAPDGYLNTHYQVNEPDRRYTNLRDNHELYCAGHLFEAAAAHCQATGKRSLLDVAIRLADHLDATFGPQPPKRAGYCGHPEAELALVKLARAAAEPRYTALARHFLETRGSHYFAAEHGVAEPDYDGADVQDDGPIREHAQIKGHAVRAAYLMSGIVDIAAETGDATLLPMLDRVWRNTVERRAYITGGIGPSAHNEGFTADYDLPNRTAYQETCASVALAMWAHRMSVLHTDAAYADAMETALYNGFLAGVSLDGTRFFYVNPLESAGDHHRSEWFGCACCPPNVTRTIAAIGGYAYAASPGALAVNLWIQGSVQATAGGADVRMQVRTDYPWDGRARITLETGGEAAFDLLLRVPGWCRSAAVAVNGAPVEEPERVRGYLRLPGPWRDGDTVEVDMPMPVRRVVAHPAVRADAGCAAIQRGPLVYCLEQVDHGVPVGSIALPPGAPLQPLRLRNRLGGITALTGTGLVPGAIDWEDRLYHDAAPPQATPVFAVPYCVWDNREAGEMRVWMPELPVAAA